MTRTADGEWLWTIYDKIHKRADLLRLLGEYILAITLMLLAWNAALYIVTREPIGIKFAVTSLAWPGWLLLFSTAPGYIDLMYFLFFSLYCILPVTLILVAINGVMREKIDIKTRLLIRKDMWLVSLIPALLFLLPYILWLYGIIPEYTIAAGLALVLAIVSLVVRIRKLKERLDEQLVDEQASD